jgi:outer membrane protein
MEMFKKRLAFILLAGGMSTGAFAQDKNWSLEDCIQYALEHNLSVKQSQNNTAISAENLKEANMASLPNANASINQSHNSGFSIDPFTNSRKEQTVRSNNFSFSSGVTLFNGFRIKNAKKESIANFEASKLDLEKMKNDIAMNVALAYLQVLFNQELVTIAERQLATTAIQVDRLKELVDAGAMAKGNLLDVESQYAAEEQQLVNAQNQLDISRLNIMQLLELEAGQAFKVQKPEHLKVDQLLSNNSETVYQKALGIQPQIQAAEHRVSSSEYSLLQAKGNRYPTLSMNGSVSSFYSDASQTLDGQSVPFSEQIDNNQSYTLSFSLQIPIFNRNQVNSSIARTQLSLENSKLLALQEKRTLRKNIEQAYADANAAMKQYLASDKAVAAFEESFSYMQERYNLGMVNTYEYNDAKNKYMKAESDRLQAKYDYAFKVRILDFYATNQLTLQ